MLKETIQMRTANHSTTGNVNTTLQCNHCKITILTKRLLCLVDATTVSLTNSVVHLLSIWSYQQWNWYNI